MMKHKEVIQKLIDNIGAKTYLEIGTASGMCFFSIKAKRKIGIDTKTWLTNLRLAFEKKTNTLIFSMTSNLFFEKHKDLFSKDKIDVAFIDGLHTYEQSLKDVNNVLEHLSNNGFIILHDCAPLTKKEASPIPPPNFLPSFAVKWTGDVWKTIVYLRSKRHDLNVFVLDSDFGIGIITKAKPESVLDYSEKQIKELTYEDLEKNKQEMLDLKKPEYLYFFLENSVED
jgi:hypothetical protein